MAVRKVMRDVVSEKSVPLRVAVEVPPAPPKPEPRIEVRREVVREEVKMPPPPPPPPAPAPAPEQPRPAFLSVERRQERRANYPGGPLLPTSSGPKRHWVLGALGLILLILIGAGVWATLHSKATLTVVPRSQVAAVDSSFHAYKTNVPTGALGFTVLEVSAAESAPVPAGETKHVERKATGKVTFYNAFSKEPVRLIANTRVKTTAGLVFRTSAVVTIPGYKTVSGKIEPGNIEANVTADVAGGAHNIGPSDFTLPGLSGGPMFEKVTAKSLVPFTGGLAGDIRSISDADLATARTALEASLSQKLLADAESRLPAGTILFPQGYSIAFVLDEYGTNSETAAKAASSAAANDDTQTISMSGTLTAVLFDKRELATYLAKRELPAAAEAVLDLNNWKDLNVEISDVDNATSMEEIPVSISGNAQFVWQVDETKLKQDLVGKPKTEYGQVFLSYPAIDRAEVRISPFWIKRFPQDPARIDIEIKVS